MKHTVPAPKAFAAKQLALLLIVILPVISGCTRFDLLNATIPSCGYDRTSNLLYGDLPSQKLDVYRPRRAVPHAAVVVFFYGGDWQNGSKDDYRFVAEALTSRGFIAVMPNYRLYPSVTFPAFVRDGALAVRWAHDNAASFGGDPSRVYLMGHSAGAHIAALLTLDPHYLKDVGLDRSAIRATAALSGPYDFVPPSYDLAVFNLKPGDPPDPSIEPIHFADGSAAPMLLITGMKDKTVDPGNTFRLAARIREKGGQVQVITYPNRGHAEVALALAWPFRWLAPVLNDVSKYFQDH